MPEPDVPEEDVAEDSSASAPDLSVPGAGVAAASAPDSSVPGAGVAATSAPDSPGGAPPRPEAPAGPMDVDDDVASSLDTSYTHAVIMHKYSAWQRKNIRRQFRM